MKGHRLSFIQVHQQINIIQEHKLAKESWQAYNEEKRHKHYQKNVQIEEISKWKRWNHMEMLISFCKHQRVVSRFIFEHLAGIYNILWLSLVDFKKLNN